MRNAGVGGRRSEGENLEAESSKLEDRKGGGEARNSETRSSKGKARLFRFELIPPPLSFQFPSSEFRIPSSAFRTREDSCYKY